MDVLRYSASQHGLTGVLFMSEAAVQIKNSPPTLLVFRISELWIEKKQVKQAANYRGR